MTLNHVRRFCLQLVGDNANTVLGRVWPRRSRELRTRWHQDFHSILGHADVWLLLGDKYRRAVEFAHRHDESLISADFGERKYLHLDLISINCCADKHGH